MQLRLEPYMLVSTAGAITAIRIANSAPTRAAVDQTFALALVSAPIICPAAYITPPRTTASMAAIGRREVSPLQMAETAEITELRGAANRSGTENARIMRIGVNFIACHRKVRILLQKML